jgi:hypothetical protein
MSHGAINLHYVNVGVINVVNCAVTFRSRSPYNVRTLYFQIQDAQAAMRLYTLRRKEWENSLKKRFIHRKKSSFKATEAKTGERTRKFNSTDTKT